MTAVSSRSFIFLVEFVFYVWLPNCFGFCLISHEWLDSSYLQYLSLLKVFPFLIWCPWTMSCITLVVVMVIFVSWIYFHIFSAGLFNYVAVKSFNFVMYRFSLFPWSTNSDVNENHAYKVHMLTAFFRVLFFNFGLWFEFVINILYTCFKHQQQITEFITPWNGNVS